VRAPYARHVKKGSTALRASRFPFVEVFGAAQMIRVFRREVPGMPSLELAS
jgi:hypothetical protein